MPPPTFGGARAKDHEAVLRSWCPRRSQRVRGTDPRAVP